MDLRGALVKELNLKHHGDGSTTGTWDGTDNSGRRAASGSYIFAIRSEGQVLERYVATVVNH